jgi:hypothetical protein
MEIIFFRELVCSKKRIEKKTNHLFLLGSMYEIGAETGRYYSINVPLREGITDDGERISD